MNGGSEKAADLRKSAEQGGKPYPFLELGDLRPALKPRERFSERFMPPRNGMLVFDPSRCTGCGTCEMVCGMRNVSRVAPASASVRVLRNGAEGRNFAVHCQHCRKPLCLEACPTRAISRGEDGIVRIDRVFCTGCGLCTMACPEAAPLRDPATQTIRKCDLCDGDPLCARHCPEGALTYTRGKAFRWIKGLRWTVQALSFLLLVVILIGTFCFFRAGVVSLSCPTGTLQNIASTKTVILSTVLSALALVVLTLLAGRLFCGWICPFGFVLDLVGKVVPAKVKPPRWLANRLNKYGVLAGAVGGSFALGYQAFCTVCPIGTLCRSYGVQGFFRGAELAVVPALAALEVTERRSWCRYLCPVGALLALVASAGLIKIVIGAKKCKKFSCIQCAEVCPMGIIDGDLLREGVSPKVPMKECISCFRCVDRCPYGAAKIRFRWQKGIPGEGRP